MAEANLLLYDKYGCKKFYSICLRCHYYIIFVFVTDAPDKQSSLSVPEKPLLSGLIFAGRHDTQHNDIQQKSDTEYNGT
jgi:hypothetical protein